MKKILIVEDSCYYRFWIASTIYDLGEIRFCLKEHAVIPPYATILPEKVAETIKQKDYSFCFGKMASMDEAIKMILWADLILLDKQFNEDECEYNSSKLLPYCTGKKVIGISSYSVSDDIGFPYKSSLDKNSGGKEYLRNLIKQALTEQ